MNFTVYGDLYMRIVVKYTFCDIFLPSAIIFTTGVQDILQQQLYVRVYLLVGGQ